MARMVVAAVAVMAVLSVALAQFIPDVDITWKVPMTLTVQNLSIFTGPNQFGRGIPSPSAIGGGNGLDIVGGGGSLYISPTGGQVQYSRGSNNFGNQVAFTRVRKNGNNESDFATVFVGGTTPSFVIVGDSTENEVSFWTNNKVVVNSQGFIPPNGNSAGGNSQYTFVNGITGTAGAPVGGTVIRQVSAWREIFNTAGNCVKSFGLVVRGTGNQGLVQGVEYDGYVAIDSNGSFAISGYSPAVNNAPGFGKNFAAARTGNFFAVSSESGVIVMSIPVDNAGCTLSFSVAYTITPGAGRVSGVSLAQDNEFYAAVGIPGAGPGEVRIYRLDGGGATTLVQTLSPPDDIPELPIVANQRFGEMVRFGANSETNYVAVGSPGYAAEGLALFYTAEPGLTPNDPDEGLLTLLAYSNSSEIPANGGLGEFMTASNCRQFVFGEPSVDSVVTFLASIGAYYEDYCTCERENIFDQGIMFPVPNFPGESPTTCRSSIYEFRFNCLMEGAPSICTYSERPTYEWTEEVVDPDNTPCELVSRIQRRLSQSNCFQDYVTLQVV
uniref:Glycoprotein n=1 Tax=Porphyridium sp. UTEX 637 TaxID=299626 RepID=Q5U8S3_9RHOD|nr:glycoprotein [Porphyridium sp. UTEX 637]